MWPIAGPVLGQRWKRCPSTGPMIGQARVPCWFGFWRGLLRGIITWVALRPASLCLPGISQAQWHEGLYRFKRGIPPAKTPQAALSEPNEDGRELGRSLWEGQSPAESRQKCLIGILGTQYCKGRRAVKNNIQSTNAKSPSIETSRNYIYR